MYSFSEKSKSQKNQKNQALGFSNNTTKESQISQYSFFFFLSVQVTNGTLTFSQEQSQVQQKKSSSTTSYLVPSSLKMTSSPSSRVEVKVPFADQPELRLYDASGTWVQNVGTQQLPWILSASLLCPQYSNQCNASSLESQLLGNKTATFVDGTARFNDLAIGRGGADYVIILNVTSPEHVDFSVHWDNIRVTDSGATEDGNGAVATSVVDDVSAGSIAAGIVAVVAALIVVVSVVRCRLRRKQYAKTTSRCSIITKSSTTSEKSKGSSFSLNNNVVPISFELKQQETAKTDLGIGCNEMMFSTFKNKINVGECEPAKVTTVKNNPSEISFRVDEFDNACHPQEHKEDAEEENKDKLSKLNHPKECLLTKQPSRLSPIPESNTKLPVVDLVVGKCEEVELDDLSPWEQVTILKISFIYRIKMILTL